MKYPVDSSLTNTMGILIAEALQNWTLFCYNKCLYNIYRKMKYIYVNIYILNILNIHYISMIYCF